MVAAKQIRLGQHSIPSLGRQSAEVLLLIDFVFDLKPVSQSVSQARNRVWPDMGDIIPDPDVS